LVKRKIVKIDEEKCNGCGLCIPRCAEGALRIINGKAKLVSETYCDGLGACLGKCPQDAITIEEREAQEFNAETSSINNESPYEVRREDSSSLFPTPVQIKSPQPVSQQWPVQLALVSPGASFLENADILLVADCVPFVVADFHAKFMRKYIVLVACPKLDNFQEHRERLTAIIRQSKIKSITVLHMEVPCCSGLTQLAKQAIASNNKDIPLRDITIKIDGTII